MNEHVRHLSLAQQIDAVNRARSVVIGAARPPARAAERDFEAEALDAALRTLRWLRAHEPEIRTACAPKRARDPSAAGACVSESGDGARAEESKRCEFPLARRAAIRCAEPAFQKFLGVDTAEAAADALRKRCEVVSRKDFDRDAAARERWRALEAAYRAWLGNADVEGGA